MRIIYWTTDDVNFQLARRFARGLGARLESAFFPEAVAPSEEECVLYDLDYLPFDMRREIMDQLLHGYTSRPQAVHSYNVSDSDQETLQARGVAVYRRLDEDVVRALCVSLESATPSFGIAVHASQASLTMPLPASAVA